MKKVNTKFRQPVKLNRIQLSLAWFISTYVYQHVLITSSSNLDCNLLATNLLEQFKLEIISGPMITTPPGAWSNSPLVSICVRTSNYLFILFIYIDKWVQFLIASLLYLRRWLLSYDGLCWIPVCPGHDVAQYNMDTFRFEPLSLCNECTMCCCVVHNWRCLCCVLFSIYKWHSFSASQMSRGCVSKFTASKMMSTTVYSGFQDAWMNCCPRP